MHRPLSAAETCALQCDTTQRIGCDSLVPILLAYAAHSASHQRGALIRMLAGCLPNRSVLICLWTVLFTTFLSADSLRGTVRDTTGAAIAGARVSASSKSASASTVTSFSGYFEIRDLSVPATVTVSANGFAATTADWNGGNFEVVLHPSLSQEVVVVATRLEATLGEVAASVSRIGPEEVAASPSLQIDNVLRQVPGFSLFRRSDSRTANPTSQGVSLRGLGASGASRALVLYNGVPLNDPFGGWVYWNRVPVIDVGSIEVLRGGGSALYGAGALAGVVSLRSRESNTPSITFESYAGGQNTRSAGITFSGLLGRWGIAGTAQGMRTDGYVPVPRELRGQIDVPANVRYGTGRLVIDHPVGAGSAFISGNVFNESRQNGTAFQTNSTRLAEGTAGLDHPIAGGTFSARAYGSAQRFNQTFSSIAENRNSESLVRVQAVPAQQSGASAQWIRQLTANNVLTLGADIRHVRGHTDEVIHVRGTPNARVLAGGRQLLTGVFAEDMLRIGSRLHVTGALRLDSWRNYDASSITLPLSSTANVEERGFPSKASTRISPSLGAAFRLTPLLSITASGYGAFRNPTLNELYRGFRLGNVQTIANELLRAERLKGWETGLNAGSEHVFARATFFWNHIDDAVGNRTLEVTPSLITRQRQNIGALKSRGVELEARANLPASTWIRAAYEHANANVSESLELALVGLRIPQVPRNSVSVELGHLGKRWTATAVGRYVGRQFDDDLNRFPLPGYFTADVFAGYRITRFAEVFAACENLLDRSYEVGRTPTPTLGSPRLARGGLRFRWEASAQ